MSPPEIGLPEALERAASALAGDADDIRPANGDPFQLANLLDDEAAGRVLRWLLANEPAAGAELATQWAEDPEGAGRHVLGLDLDALPKPARKALRRVLHRLRSQGLELPKPEPKPVVAKLPSVEDRLEQASLSPIDPRGSRVAYLALDHPSGGVRLFEVVFDDVNGIVGFEVYTSGRSKVRRFLKAFEKGGKLTAVTATPDAIRALVARALAVHPSDRPLPKGFSEFRSRLAVPADGIETPGEEARRALEPADADAALAQGAVWVAAGTVGPWPPSIERVRAFADRISERADALGIATPDEREAEVNTLLDEGIVTLFDDAHRACTALRFDETAYVFWKGGREDDARIALALADSFRSGEAANPLARAMLQVLLSPVLEKLRAEADDSAPAESD
jgi:hypothetical protein